MSSLVPSPLAPKSNTLRTVEGGLLSFFGGAGGMPCFGGGSAGAGAFRGGGDGGFGSGDFGDGTLCFGLPALLWWWLPPWFFPFFL